MAGTTLRDWQDAITVQDACNLSGVIHFWDRLVTRIWEEAQEGEGRGTDWVNRHPLNVMLASKVASLTGCEVGENFHLAYEEVKDRIVRWEGED